MSILHEALIKAEKDRKKKEKGFFKKTEAEPKVVKQKLHAIRQLELDQERAIRKLTKPRQTVSEVLINSFKYFSPILLAAVIFVGFYQVQIAMSQHQVRQNKEKIVALNMQVVDILEESMQATTARIDELPADLLITEPVPVDDIAIAPKVIEAELIEEVTGENPAVEEPPVVVTPIEPSVIEPPNLSCNGIVTDAQGGFYCIINNMVLREGQMIRGAKITRIESDLVHLSFKGLDFSIGLFQ